MRSFARHPAAWFFAAISVALMAVYWPAMRGSVLMDDDVLIFGNPNLRSVEGLVNTWTNAKANQDFYPLTITSWWVERLVFGRKFLPYHVDNVLLHALNATLVLVLMRKLRLDMGVSILTAALFAVHPIQVESVAWMAQRKNVLSGALYLLSAITFVKAMKEEPDREQREKSAGSFSRSMYAASIGLFVLAMLAKPVTMTLAATLAILVCVRDRRMSRRAVWLSVPYLILCVPMILLTTWVQRSVVIGTVGEMVSMSPMERALVALNVPEFYLSKILWPSGFCFSYPKWAVNVSQWQWMVGPAILAAAVIGAAVCLRALPNRRRVVPIAVVGAYLITLSPALGIVPIYWHIFYYVADHVAYLAAIAVFAAGAGALMGMSEWVSFGSAKVAAVLPFVVVIPLAVISHEQAKIYMNAQTLWSKTIERNHDAFIAYTNLGVIAEQARKLEIAEELYRDAIRIDPRFADAQFDLGNVLYSQKRYAEALEHFRLSLKMNSRDVRAISNLALALSMDAQHAEAVAEGRKAVEIREDDALAQFALGTALVNAGDAEESIPCFVRALEINPRMDEAERNLATAYVAVGKKQAASEDRESAVKSFRQAIEVNPVDADAYVQLAISLGTMGQLEDAAEAAQRATELEPTSAEAWCNLGVARIQMHKVNDARIAWAKAATLDAKGEAGNRAREYLARTSANSTTNP